MNYIGTTLHYAHRIVMLSLLLTALFLLLRQGVSGVHAGSTYTSFAAGAACSMDPSVSTHTNKNAMLFVGCGGFLE